MRLTVDTLLARLSHGSAEHCISESAFSNLYLFRDIHDYRFISGNWPGISGIAYDGSRHLMPLFDPSKTPISVLDALLERHECVFPVSSRHVAELSPQHFNVSQSRADADYLYTAATFIDYPGRLLAKKRNLIRQFRSAHTVTTELFSKHLANAAMQVLQGWMEQKGKSKGQADDAACREAIDLADMFRLEGLVYFDKGHPIGFLLAQELQPGVFVMRFAKGIDVYKGLYPYMFQEFIKQFSPRVSWLNFEQDMGLPGFRRSKLSFQPCALLPKLRVRRNC